MWTVVYTFHRRKIVKAGQANHPISIPFWNDDFPKVVLYMKIEFVPPATDLASLMLITGWAGMRATHF